MVATAAVSIGILLPNGAPSRHGLRIQSGIRYELAWMQVTPSSS